MYHQPCLVNPTPIQTDRFPFHRCCQRTDDARTNAKRLVKSYMVHQMPNGYRLHDLVLEYLRVYRVEEQDLRTSTRRQAEFLAQTNVLDSHWKGESSVGGGFYSLVTSWESVMELNRELDVEEFYANSLKHATKECAFREAGYLLKFLVR